MAHTKIQKQNMPLIQPLVDHIMAIHPDTNAWRHELIQSTGLPSQVFDSADAAAIELAYRTMKTLEFGHMSDKALVDELDHQHVSWQVDLPEDLQQGAVGY